MFIVSFTSILALFLTYLDTKRNTNEGIKCAFLLVTFLAVIHFDYGSDYLSYYEIYRDIVKYPFNFANILSGDVFKDIGWVFLSYFFKDIGGFFMMVAVLSIVQNFLVYNVIVNYVDKKWRTLSVFVYLFYTTFYLLNFSMLRQGLVICVFLGIWPLIQQRKIILSLIILLLCTTIHKSSLVLLPFAFWSFLPFRNNKLLAISLVICYLLLWFGGTFINQGLNSFLQVETFEKFANTYGNGNYHMKLGIGFVLNHIPLVLSIFYLMSKGDNISDVDRSVVMLATLGFIIIPFASIMLSINRVGMYFSVYQIIAIPKIYDNLKNAILKRVLLFILVFMTMYDYIIFFQSPTWIDKYSTFKTIFPIIFQ